jgi:hypothetical protein
MLTTLESFFHYYRDHLESKRDNGGISEEQCTETLAHVTSLLKFRFNGSCIGIMLPTEIKRGHIDSYLASFPVSRRDGALTAVVTCFTWLKEQGYIEAPFIRGLCESSKVRLTPTMALWREGEHLALEFVFDAVADEMEGRKVKEGGVVKLRCIKRLPRNEAMTFAAWVLVINSVSIKEFERRVNEIKWS